ncbi:hypothetical protein ACLKA7_009564 [Drosophila subpalustris]
MAAQTNHKQQWPTMTQERDDDGGQDKTADRRRSHQAQGIKTEPGMAPTQSSIWHTAVVEAVAIVSVFAMALCTFCLRE